MSCAGIAATLSRHTRARERRRERESKRARKRAKRGRGQVRSRGHRWSWSCRWPSRPAFPGLPLAGSSQPDLHVLSAPSADAARERTERGRGARERGVGER
eukprot:3017002-Rhodomonas_salina.1